ncbi:hypothetical protein ACFE04_001738 [Oxalis oulophora]
MKHGKHYQDQKQCQLPMKLAAVNNKPTKARSLNDDVVVVVVKVRERQGVLRASRVARVKETSLDDSVVRLREWSIVLPSSEFGNHIAHYRLASIDNHILTSIAHILRWRRGRLLLHHWRRYEIVPYENIVASIQFD